MARVNGPLFSMGASGSFGSIVFDARGYAYPKPNRRDAQSPRQGNFRQAISVAQKCAGVCGDMTREQIRELADDASHWNAYLTRQLIGPKRATFVAALAEYTAGELDQSAWEAAAASLGLHEVHLPYAEEPGISPGAQLFVLASSLFGLGLYTSLGSPNGNAQEWKDSITL